MERTWSIREYRKGDEEGILKLTEAVYGEVLDKDRWMRWWNWKYRDNPGGTGRIWLAEDNGKFAGQYPLIFMRLKLGNQVVKASQNVDLMTHPDYRFQGIAKELGRQALNEVGEEGVPITTGFANENSYVVDLKAGWFDVDAQSTIIKPLNLENIVGKYISNKAVLKICAVSINFVIKTLYRTARSTKVNGLTITLTTCFDERINDFWKKIQNDYEIMVVRDQEYLNWRYVNIPDVNYTICLAEKEGQILGYAVLKCEKQQGLIWGSIFELMTPSKQQEVAQSLIQKAIVFFKEEKVDLIRYRVIGSKAYCKTFRKNGFINSRFISRKARFRFIARANSPKISETFLRDPDHWFVQMGDSDAL